MRRICGPDFEPRVSGPERLPPQSGETLRAVGQDGYHRTMCRSIKRLRAADGELATDEQIREAALQFVRKVSGYRAPSKRNTQAFEAAVDEVADASRRLLEAVAPPVPRR